MVHKICFIGGDGVGPELVGHARRMLDELGVEYDAKEAKAGYACFQECGTPLPQETTDAAKWSDAIMFGAVTTPPDIPNYKSAIVGLRKALDMYANVRPIRSFQGAPSLVEGIDFTIVRENTEDVYGGKETISEDGEIATTERVITRKGSERIARFAFEYAKRNKKNKVTIVNKANVMRKTCGLFRSTALKVAQEYAPGIFAEEVHVDAMAMRMIKQPREFSVIVTTNMFGDILSDEAAQLVGGLGMSPSANIGESNALFEPTHGSAPKYTGKDYVNPCATLLSLRMLLSHIGENEAAGKLRDAIDSVLKEGKTLTADIGGKASTSLMVSEIIAHVKATEKIMS